MFDELLTYYLSHVVEAFVEYREADARSTTGRNLDVRRATAAAEALFHLREHLPATMALRRAQVESLCPDYGLLGDIANASKHRAITGNTPHGSPLIDSAERIREQVLVILYNDDQGNYRHVCKVVNVTLVDGTHRMVLEVLTNVINFWEQYLFEKGVLSRARPFTFKDPVRARTRDEANDGNLDLEIIRGQALRQEFLLLNFDPATGTATPLDLTGMGVRGRIYKPRYAVDLTLTEQSTGREFTQEVELSEEEHRQLAACKSEEERNAGMCSLASVKQMLGELVGRAKKEDLE